MISPLLCRFLRTKSPSWLTCLLIALMKNQVDALRGYGVKVHLLSSESTMEERQEVGTQARNVAILPTRVLHPRSKRISLPAILLPGSST